MNEQFKLRFKEYQEGQKSNLKKKLQVPKMSKDENNKIRKIAKEAIKNCVVEDIIKGIIKWKNIEVDYFEIEKNGNFWNILKNYDWINLSEKEIVKIFNDSVEIVLNTPLREIVNEIKKIENEKKLKKCEKDFK